MSLDRLPLRFRIANRVGRLVNIDHLARARFDSARLLDDAVQKTGLEDFGDPYFREGLEILLKSINQEAGLHPIGRLGIRGMILTQLANRLRFVEWMKAERSQPSELIPPLIILGIPRSGTTFLHRMLVENETFRYLSFWELMRPFPEDREGDHRRERVAAALKTRLQMNGNLDRKHFIRADSPEECIWLLNLTFVSHGYWVAAPVYSYLDWHNSCDRLQAYQEYRNLLEYFQRQQPGKRLILKAPSHTGSIRALLQAIPEALIVQCHRDPVEVFGSFNSLMLSVHSVVSDRLRPRQMAQANLRMLLNECELNNCYRKENESSIFDLRYAELTGDPVGVVRRLYGAFQLEWSDRIEQRTLDYLRTNPKGKHGSHHYRNEDFGESFDSIADHFKDYRSRFACDI